jgi:hypothetical protein
MSLVQAKLQKATQAIQYADRWAERVNRLATL